MVDVTLNHGILHAIGLLTAPALGLLCMISEGSTAEAVFQFHNELYLSAKL